MAKQEQLPWWAMLAWHWGREQNMRVWWRWTLLSLDGVAPSQMVCVSASVNLPLHHNNNNNNTKIFNTYM